MMKHIAITLSLLLSLLCASYGQMQMGMRGQGKPIYYPFQLDSLFYWYDAMDASSLLDSVGGTVGNNEGVATWADKSGRNWDVTQATNTARPVYKSTGGPGGNTPALQFDGSNDFLASAAHWWGSDDLTVFVVMNFGNATRNASEGIITRYRQATNARQFAVSSAGVSISYGHLFSWSSNGSSSAPNTVDFSYGSSKSTAYRVITWTSNSSNSGTTLNVDGTNTGLTDGNSGITTTSMYDFNQVTSIGLIDDLTPAAFLQGSISEIIIYSRALTADERVGVEQYLKRKWGL